MNFFRIFVSKFFELFSPCPIVPKKSNVALYARQTICVCYKSKGHFGLKTFGESRIVPKNTDGLLCTFAAIHFFWFSARPEPT